MYFVPADGKDYVVFGADGNLSGPAFPDFKFYTVTDKATINMTKADKSVYQNYYYRIKNDTLSMSPSGPSICIEGCAIELVKE